MRPTFFNTPHALRHLLAGLALSAATLGSAQAAPTLAITGPSSVGPGSSFTLQVTATDVADLFGHQFDVTFNPALFQAGSVGEGGFLSAGGSTYFDGGVIDNDSGTISFVLGTLIGDGPGVSGAGVLATLGFASIGSSAAVGTFGLANVALVNSRLEDIAVSTLSLNVSAVPEPSTWALLLAGMAGVAGAARRRRAATA